MTEKPPLLVSRYLFICLNILYILDLSCFMRKLRITLVFPFLKKSSLNLLQYCFCFLLIFVCLFVFGPKAHGILAPWPEVKPATSAWKVESFWTFWTAREDSSTSFKVVVRIKQTRVDHMVKKKCLLCNKHWVRILLLLFAVILHEHRERCRRMPQAVNMGHSMGGRESWKKER